MSDPIVHASENSHWYSPDGTPLYEVERADGKGLRAATLRDARKLGLFPGVSAIMQCAYKPQLEEWKINQAILAALTLPRSEGEMEDAWIGRVKQDAKETAAAAAAVGTAIHAAIQQFYTDGTIPDLAYEPHVLGSVSVLDSVIGQRNDWKPERCAVSMEYGFGTKVDLSSDGWIVDWKGKEFDESQVGGLKIYSDHFMQLAASREVLGMPSARCAIGYVSRNHAGLCHLIEAGEGELQRGWMMFLALLDYWRADRGYDPRVR